MQLMRVRKYFYDREGISKESWALEITILPSPGAIRLFLKSSSSSNYVVNPALSIAEKSNYGDFYTYNVFLLIRTWM